MATQLIFQPVAVMLLLTVIVAFFTMLTRVKAMKELKVHPQKGQDTRALRQHLPHEINRIANNYNHLFEQPVLFYVVCFGLYLTNTVTNLTILFAWAYVLIRVCHTLAQTLQDKVMLRFTLFMLSWLPLIALIVQFTTELFQ